MNTIPTPNSGDGRRAFLREAWALLAGTTTWKAAIAATEQYAQTIAAIAYAFQRETDAQRRCVDFAGVASQEGYKGIAYVFSAFAAFEGVHARNFKGLMTRLGAQANAVPTTIKRGTTKQNLMAAVDDEIDSIDALSPRTLDRVRVGAGVRPHSNLNFP